MRGIAEDLKVRFDFAAQFYLEAWEYDPETVIKGNVKCCAQGELRERR